MKRLTLMPASCRRATAMRMLSKPPGHIEAALGGDFLAVFRHEAGVVRLELEGEAEHFRRSRPFRD